jgi:hydrogenase expression/formation protein HypD
VVFFGLGFETTMPPTALTLIRAKADNVRNFSLFCNHVLVPPPLKALLDDPLMRIDGFVGPGHVSMIIGAKPYDFIAKDYHKPLVIAGFEPLDLLQAVVMVLQQIKEGRCEIENQYGRVVPENGNQAALKAIDDVYEMRDKFDWRGLGEIDHSGVKIRKAYADFDAEEKFHVGYAAGKTSGREPEGCRCGDVVKGMIKPWACEKYGKDCTPEHPMGALMVSTEGACSAYYLYSGVRAEDSEDVSEVMS